MKILCLIDSLGSGGAERQMANLSSLLTMEGHEVHLVVFSHGYDFYYEMVRNNGVHLQENVKGRNRFRRAFEIVKLVRLLKPDAVIAYKDGVTMAACIARILTKFKLIVSERNTTQSLSQNERIKFLLYRFADFIVPNSYSQNNFIRNHYPKLADHCIVITNVLNTEEFKTVDAKKDNNPPIIVTTARVSPQKNTLTYLKAISILKSRNVKAHFVWYGNQTDEYFNQVQDTVRKSDIEEMIEFLPPVKNVVEVYHSADVFCLPSIFEGFPNVVCEAMSCGLPIVCGNVCDNPYIVEDGINGFLFDSNNAEDITNKIERILDLGTDQLHIIGERNTQKISEICSPKIFIDKYLELITK